jgi:hypothetical protein
MYRHHRQSRFILINRYQMPALLSFELTPDDYRWWTGMIKRERKL